MIKHNQLIYLDSFNKEKNTFENNLELFKYENFDNIEKIIKLMEESFRKVSTLNNKINDNDRYILMNLTKLHTITQLKPFLIENKIFLETTEGQDKLFSHENKNFYFNLKIKPDPELVDFVKNYLKNGLNSEYANFYNYCREEIMKYNKEEKFEKEQSKLSNSVYNSYLSGGYSGGNCWNDDEPTYFQAEEENDYDKLFFLHPLLEKLKPEISWLDGERIKQNILKKMDTEYYTESEYYGNSSNYSINYIKIAYLYSVLKENNIHFDNIIKESASISDIKNKIKNNNKI